MFKTMAKNFRKPKGILGSVILNEMNKGHDYVTRWALSFANLTEDMKILDVGCGGGNAISHMAVVSKDVFGIDYSELAVKKAIKKNKKSVQTGKVRIKQGNVEKLVFENDTFDLVTAFETIYFWPDWEENFKEIYRVIKPNGRFMAVYEITKDSEKNKELAQKIGMKIPSVEQMETLFTKTGFADICVHTEDREVWKDVCVIGKKQS